MKSTALDNHSFMALWGTYSHCKNAQDITAVHEDMGTLTTAATATRHDEGFILPMPGALERLVSNPAPRLAVDIHAMAASCSLHAGHVSLEQGRIDLARTTFARVLTLPTDSHTPSYYQQQAQHFLSEIDSGVQLSKATR